MDRLLCGVRKQGLALQAEELSRFGTLGAHDGLDEATVGARFLGRSVRRVILRLCRQTDSNHVIPLRTDFTPHVSSYRSVA